MKRPIKHHQMLSIQNSLAFAGADLSGKLGELHKGTLGVAKLFVKSVKVPIVSMETHDIPGHYCQNGYRTQSTMISHSTEDKRAKEVLTISHVKFELVDLADGKGANKLAAWLGHVKTTPTLIVPGSPNRKYEGVSAISDFVRSQA